MSQLFVQRYQTDAEFREFINDSNTDAVLMEFVYDLYMKYGSKTINVAHMYVNHDLLNIDNVINHFESIGEFERCQRLVELKKSL